MVQPQPHWRRPECAGEAGGQARLQSQRVRRQPGRSGDTAALRRPQPHLLLRQLRGLPAALAADRAVVAANHRHALRQLQRPHHGARPAQQRAAVCGQPDSREPDGSGGAQTPVLLPGCEPGGNWRGGHRHQLRDSDEERAGRGQDHGADGPPAVFQGPAFRPLPAGQPGPQPHRWRSGDLRGARYRGSESSERRKAPGRALSPKLTPFHRTW